MHIEAWDVLEIDKVCMGIQYKTVGFQSIRWGLARARMDFSSLRAHPSSRDGTLKEDASG